MLERLPQHSAAVFVCTHSAEDIAIRLQADDALIKNGSSCSWVALYTPNGSTPEAMSIANRLAHAPNLSGAVKRMLYESLVSRLRRNLNENGIFGTQSELITAKERLQNAQESRELLPEQIAIALEVLTHLQRGLQINSNTPARDTITLLEQDMASKQRETIPDGGDGPHIATSDNSRISNSPPIPRKRRCYLCRLSLTVPHPTQPALCAPCGDFNIASARLSLPCSLTLPATFTALITGARINLGYHTALRLLRCGARVLATSRYPRDAVARYTQEPDYPAWKHRLRVLGADFRNAKDVFALVSQTKRCLLVWGGEERLHLLVNNAAQTLTDSVSKEERAIEREVGLLETAERSGICIQGTYKAKVRGGGLSMALGGIEKERGLIEDVNTDDKRLANIAKSSVPQIGGATQEVTLYTKSSWVQNIFEIPYEDVISAHSVNTFVPLILCREFLPLMGSPRDSEADHGSSTTKAAGYIINVSSREGIFEDCTDSAGKAGKHVHTNMSKAALNMITETEAASAWHCRRVAMNTVDPGYMSAAPEYEKAFDGQRPIGWEDGAGRVLWPVAISELEGRIVWGRFLKHYGAVEVDPGVGRG